MNRAPTIRKRILDPDECRWIVLSYEGWYRACAPHCRYDRDRHFPTLSEACDYARTMTPQEAP